MRSVLLGAVAFALAASTNGCSVIFGPDQSVVLHVQEIEAPATVAPGAAFTAVLTVTLGGCLSFHHIETRRNAAEANITVWGRDASKGRDDVGCPADIRTEERTVRFDPPFTATFDIAVERPGADPLTARVRVQ